jgi:group I intron endonuclease
MHTCGIYEIRNTVNGKRYIGSSTDAPDRLRHHLACLRRGGHHSTKLQRAFQKYGEAAFQFSLLLVCTKRDLVFYENRALAFFRCATKNGYNMNARADRPAPLTPAGRARLSEAARGNRYRRGRKQPPDAIAKRAAAIAAWGPERRVEWITKLSVAHLGKRASAETRAKQAAANCGREFSTQSRAKIAAALRGKPKSVEHRGKLADANRGKVRSPESRARQSASLRQWWARRKGAVS